ncbi:MULTISPECIES: LysR family transcriptional regulator [Hydrogenophaga]|uniref:LysR family transcriptional regulator n=1 Tax=Hydrogenophaga electricum TaxID=1230953 RepID=A0ABQ6C102_9BURK|nr:MULTISPECIES: LysR family transcriptional regulator [Hydrogenophaga]GLS13937.1 LysR family transcriptional regulator [Hydrogenophaga electricum]
MNKMHPTDKDLNLLIIFEALMETRSVSKAGERLNLSQPSMSHALSKMRRAFDDPMFVRVKNEMQPTLKALEVAEPVRQALSLARRQIFSRAALDLRTSSRQFTICMTDVGETCYMPMVINAVRNHAPGVRLRTVSPIVEKLEEGLESGGVDLAIGYFPDITNGGVFQQRLLRNSGFLCITGDKDIAARGELDLVSFQTALHIAVRTEGRSQEVIEKAMAAMGIHRNVVATIPHYLGLLTIIPQTGLTAIVPMDLISAFEGKEGITALPLPFASPSVEVIQIWHKRNHEDLSHRWLRTLVRDTLQRRVIG